MTECELTVNCYDSNGHPTFVPRFTQFIKVAAEGGEHLYFQRYCPADPDWDGSTEDGYWL